MPFGKDRGYCNQGTELIKVNEKLRVSKERNRVLEEAITKHRWEFQGEPTANDLALWGMISVNP